MKFNKQSISGFTIKVITWLCVAFTLDTSRSLKDFLGLLRNLQKIETNNGKVHLTIYCKNARLALARYLAGQAFKTIDKVSLTVDGIPVILGPWIPSLRKGDISTSDLKLIFTIFVMTRALNLGTEADIGPIVGASNYILPPFMSSYVPQFWRELGYSRIPNSVPKRAQFSQYHQSAKVSPSIEPSSKNAVYHSIGDLLALPESLYKSIETVGGPVLAEKMATLKRAVKEIPELSFFVNCKKSTSIRKISSFPDKELKVRVIALGDYFSQTALKPLHQFLFYVLKKIPQDMTFDQTQFLQTYKNHKIFYSLDLTSATDRFPIKVIELVLRGRFPSSYVDAWLDIMVGQPFNFREPNGKWTTLSYKVGNPMGFYSSWASFALSHHFVVFYCCKSLKMSWLNAPYYLLGDDLLICNKELAEKYMEVMKLLDVGISEPKSFISPHFFELAKRQFYKGEEISPYPVSSIKESLSNVSTFVATLIDLEGRGWLAKTAPSKAIALGYGCMSSYRSVYKSKMEHTAYLADKMLRCIRGAEPAGKAISSIFSKLGYPMTVSDKIGNSIIENIVVDRFSQQPEMKPIKLEGPPTFELAANLVMLLTGLDEERLPLGFETIYALPVTQIHGQIEETYMNLVSKAKQISQTGGNWPSIFRSLALPSSDAIFSERASKSITRVSSQIAKDLSERAQILIMYPQLLQD